MFYDDRIQVSGEIAEKFRVSISDVADLLMMSGGNRDKVEEALTEASKSEEAKEAEREGKQYDLVLYARNILKR